MIVVVDDNVWSMDRTLYRKTMKVTKESAKRKYGKINIYAVEKDGKTMLTHDRYQNFTELTKAVRLLESKGYKVHYNGKLVKL